MPMMFVYEVHKSSINVTNCKLGSTKLDVVAMLEKYRYIIVFR